MGSAPHQTVELYSVVSSLPESLAPAFQNSRMWWSNNFLGILKSNALSDHALPRLRKPIFELLVVRHRGNLISSGAIDQYEARMWREQFALDRQGRKDSHPDIQIALFDLGLQTVVDTGRNPLRDGDLLDDPNFRKDLIRWKFLAGQPNFSRGDRRLLEAGKAWVDECGNRALMQKQFLEIQKFYGQSSYKGSDMALLLEIDEELLRV
jgi:hypothetical protein